jgi:hypothetical protein
LILILSCLCLTQVSQYTPVAFELGHFRVNASLSPEATQALGHISPAAGNAVSDSTYPQDQPTSIDNVKVPADAFPLPQARAVHDVDPDEDAVSVTTRTDDDPVRDAFDQALDQSKLSDDEDEEEIVWQPGYAFLLL